MIARGQSKAARRARLALGCCPTHGVALQVASVHADGAYVVCPRRDCTFDTFAHQRTKLYRAICEVSS